MARYWGRVVLYEVQVWDDETNLHGLYHVVVIRSIILVYKYMEETNSANKID